MKEFEIDEASGILLKFNPSLNNNKEIIIPEGVTEIKDRAFFNCNDIESIIFPSTLRTVNRNAFYRCEQLKKIAFKDTKERLTICEHAFEDCNNLKEIIFPESKLELLNAAFDECHSLQSIYLPKNVIYISKYPFHKCTGIKEINISLLNKRYGSMNCNVIYDKYTDTIIQGCYTSKIPEGTKTIDELAFFSIKFKEINFPNSLEIIRPNAFSNSNIEKVSFNEGLKFIGKYAFLECEKLNEVILPQTLEEIGDFAFYNTKIKRIKIPKDVKICDRAFCGCDKLKKIIVDNIISSTSSKITDDNVDIYVLNDNIRNKDFLRTHEKQIKPITLDMLIENGKSLKEINRIYKEMEK